MINSLDHTLEKGSRNACVNLIKNEALNIFLNGLNKDLTILVKSQRPDSLENAIAIALNEEQQLKSKLEMNQFHNRHTGHQSSSQVFRTNSFCKYCKGSNHTIENCYKLKNKNSNFQYQNRNYSQRNKPNTNYQYKSKPRQNGFEPQPLNPQGPWQPAMLR